jgi:hypothetical protein
MMRQGVTLPQTPRERRQLEGLAADLQGSPVAGKPLPARLRNFRPGADRYLAALGGPLAYMTRLRRIDTLTAEHEAKLAAAYEELAEKTAGDADAFAGRWRAVAAGWRFDELNDLIAQHNAWYPVESRLPMDPATRDYALVGGRSYRLDPLDSDWILACFPPAPPGAGQAA